MKRKDWKSEQEFAAAVIHVLREDQWDIWQEVQPSGCQRTADIVAVRGPVVMIVETKLQFGLAVTDQAFLWRNWAHLVSVAVPHNSNGYSPTLRRILQNYGIGMLVVGPSRDGAGFCDNHNSHDPALNRRAPYVDAIKKRLTDEQRAYGALAGGNDRWSPWKQTCINLERHVASNPGCTLKQAIDETRHHYESAAGARASLKKWIEADRVGHVRLRGGRLWLDWQLAEIDPPSVVTRSNL